MLAEAAPELLRRAKPPSSWPLLVVFSLLLHLMMIGLMQSQLLIRVTHSPLPTVPALPVETYLVIANPTVISPTPIEVDSGSSLPAAVANNEEVEKTPDIDPKRASDIVVEQSQTPIQQPEINNNLTEVSASADVLNLSDAKLSEPSPQPAAQRSIEQLTQRFFNHAESDALDAMAQQEAQMAHQRKTSPTLPVLKTPTFEEQYRKTLPSLIEIDCKNEVQRQLTKLTSIMGGRMTCGRTRDIQPFIEDRLEKSSSKNVSSKR